MVVDTSKRPYFDDYKENKKFHKVLFRPARAVQTRELNQIQTIFYNQLERLSDNIFDDGSMVIPGETSYDLNYSYVQVNIRDYDNIRSLLVNNGIRLLGKSSGVKANVVQFEPPVGDDPSTFYLKYTSAGRTGDVQVFQQNETISIIDALDNTIGTASTISTGNGSKFTVADGVYYVNGKYILVPTSSIILDKYGTEPSYSVGFIYKEEVITSIDDNSLLDNAQGTTNVSAPGADRLKIDLILTKVALSDIENANDDFVEIFRIEEGNLQKKARGPEYNILEDTLARRTYDESGDYTVNPFTLKIREHLKTEDNDGLFSVEEGGDETKYVAQVSPGKAYVRGYEVENLSTKNIVVDKARDTESMNNASISARLGFYVLVSNPNNVPDVNSFQKMNFRDTNNKVVGTGRVKFFQKDGNKYRMYFFDVRDANGGFDTSFISKVEDIYSDIGSAVFNADIAKEDRMFRGTSSNSLTFALPSNFIRTLLDNSGRSDTSFSALRQYNTFVSSNGTVVLQAQNNETFLSQDPQFFSASFTEGQEIVDLTTSYSLGGNPVGRTITINVGSNHSGKAIRVNLVVSKQQATQKTKAVNESQIILNSSDLDSKINGFYLNKADAVRINSVIDEDGNDLTDNFTLYHNKKPEYYGISYIEFDNEMSVEFPISVNFDYFEHSSGDFFSVDSYAGIDYKDIPVEGDVYLTDVLDFRPRISDETNDFSGQGSIVGNLPVPFSVIRADIEYYLPRNDKLYLKSDGLFGVMKGVSSLDPKDPKDPEDSMALYVMEVPAYTPETLDIRSRKVSTRRYTMEDIGKLDNRIESLEYYVSLNLLEKSAADMQIVDENTGLNRFKNGFLVDSFVDHSVGDYRWGEYHCSIGNGELRPEFSINAIDLEIDYSNSSGIVINNGMATLAYSEVKYIDQPYRTDYINVNPYAVYRWEGSIKLNPAVDNWIDTQYSKPDVTYKVFNNGNLEQSWNSWQINWTSESTSNTKLVGSEELLRDAPHGRRQAIFGEEGDFTTGGSLIQNTYKTTRTTTNVETVNDRVLSTNVIPYMRSREVEVTGKGHIPNSRMHFFFDGEKINSFVKPQNGSYGNKVVTDSDGNFKAIFKIPNNSKKRFNTGTKPLVVTDESNNRREYALSYGEANYSAKGTKETRQKTVIATREVETSNSTKSRVVTWADPIAQSFLVEQNGGAFVTSLELFFRTKDTDSPVSVDIREMENGQPTQRVVPGSKVTLNPSEVSTSNNGSKGTKFKFDYPVYLQESVEYCFVVMTNSNNYNMFIATMGQKDLSSGKYVSKQPYAGVMFKSQNASTWSEDQSSDVQFVINKAKFKTGTFNLNFVNSDMGKDLLEPDVIFTEKASKRLKIRVKKHNYAIGTSVTIEGAQGGNGIDKSFINAAHKVVEVPDVEHIVIDLSSVQQSPEASATGRVGGSEGYVSKTVQASLLNLNSGDIIFPDTSISYYAKGTTGKSVDGSESPYQQIDNWVQIENNERYTLGSPWLITNRADEVVNNGNKRTLGIMASMTSENSNISPVIDVQKVNMITPFYAINGKNEEIKPDGSNCYAKYRTNIATLEDPANSLRVYADVNQPQFADVIMSARFGNSEEELNESQWFVLDELGSNTTSSRSFNEQQFNLEDISDYTYYQVMIQMKSTSATEVPVVRGLRILALGT